MFRWSRLSLPLLPLTAALLAGAPLAAQPALTGPEILVDPASVLALQSSNGMRRVAAATDTGGHVMVAWIEGLQPPLRGRVFDASGRPLGPAFPLDTEVQTVVGATLATDAPEGFLLAWQISERINSAETRYRLLARRLSPSGQPSGDVIQVRALVAGQSPFESVQTASAPDGSFVVVWSDTSREDVFLRRFDAAGQPLTKAAPLPGRRGNEKRSNPSLAVLDDGEIRIAWTSRSNGSAPATLWVRRFARNATPLAAPVRLLAESAEARDSSGTFGADGGLLATWATWGDSSTHIRAFAPDGTPFSEHQAAVSWGGRVTAERGGTFLISSTYPYSYPQRDPHCAVAGLQLEADGTPRGPVGCLTNPSGEGQAHDISTSGTADGGFALFWFETGRTGEQDDDLRLFGQRLATASPGTLQVERAHAAGLESASAPLELRILRRDGASGTVSVDYRLTGAASGRGTVTFPDGDSTPRTVTITVSNDDVPGNDRTVNIALSRPTGGAVLGLPRRAVVELRDDDEPSPLLARAEPLIFLARAVGDDGSLQDPDLAAAPGGSFEAAWGYTEVDFPYRFNFALQGVRFDAAAFPSAAFETPCSRDAERVRLAMHPEGDFMVFWQAWAVHWTPAQPYDGFAQRFDARGAAAGPAFSLAFAVDDAAPLPKGRFVAVGRGHDAAGEGLFAHFLSTKGIDRRPPVPLTRQALQPVSPAAVATDAIGRSVVVWSVAPTGDGPAGIFARRFNALGAALGPVFRVSQWEGHDLSPGVTADLQGNFVVAWQRNWDGDGTGVYARVFNASGAPVSDEIPVNSDTVENQGAPSVALTGDGRFAVVWQSSSEESPGVAGQLFAGGGMRLGGEAQIAPGWERPTGVWSDRGYFVTIFCEYEESHYYGDLCVEIAARRLPL